VPFDLYQTQCLTSVRSVRSSTTRATMTSTSQQTDLPKFEDNKSHDLLAH